MISTSEASATIRAISAVQGTTRVSGWAFASTTDVLTMMRIGLSVTARIALSIWADSRGDLYVGEVSVSAGAVKRMAPLTVHCFQKFRRRAG